MSMTGGISFFEQNSALFENGATCVASTNTADQNLILGTNKYFRWQSIGSNDATTETLIITLPASVQISRIFLVDHNFKEYTIKYGAGAGTAFTGVVGLDGALSGITETVMARDTAYYEFTPVTTNRLVVSVLKTQTANEQKSLVQLIATTEIGTLTGYPVMDGIDIDRNDKKEQAVSGRWHIEKAYESVGFDLSLRTYPVQADIDLLDGLHARELPFLAWLCGGEPDQFRFEQRGFRLQDIYQMRIDKALKNAYDRNIYLMGVNQNYSFLEVV